MDLLTRDWKDFTFKIIEPSDYENVLDHLRDNFYLDEPLCQLMGYSSETTRSFDHKILEYLPHNMSFCAIHKENEKVAGVRIMYESTQDEYSSSPSSKNVSANNNTNIVHKLFTELEDKCNVFQMYDISRCAQLRLTSVAREYRGQGLATEMYQRSIAYLKSQGFTMAKSIFSSERTRRIGTKMGFKELARSYMKDLRNEEGMPLFPTAGIDQFVALMAIRF